MIRGMNMEDLGFTHYQLEKTNLALLLGLQQRRVSANGQPCSISRASDIVDAAPLGNDFEHRISYCSGSCCCAVRFARVSKSGGVSKEDGEATISSTAYSVC